MDIELIVYAKYDEQGSIIAIDSNIFLDDLTDWKEIDRWKQGDRYLYSHAGNGDYVIQKYGKPLYDEQGKPNFHNDFIEWTAEEEESSTIRHLLPEAYISQKHRMILTLMLILDYQCWN